MSAIASFVFSPFAENTYVVSDEEGKCAIIDPGCLDPSEQNTLLEYINDQKLTPVRLLLTHAHIDHVFGCAFVANQWGLKVEGHRGEIPVLEAVPQFAEMYGIPYKPSPPMEVFHEEGDIVEVGDMKLEVLFTPGHSPASICFLNREEGWMICGDTIFENSVGRMDLPGGDGPTLMKSITEKILTLPDDTRLLPGHMSATTVGREKANNPFIKAYQSGENIF